VLLVDPLQRLWVGANNLFDTNPPAVSLYTAPDPERQPRAKRQLRELLEWVPQHWAVTTPGVAGVGASALGRDDQDSN
jgi:hypothetical protein